MTLEGSTVETSRYRYLLDTLLGALGVPYRFAGDPTGADPTGEERCIHLTVAADGVTAALTPPLSHAPELSSAFSTLARVEEYENPARDEHDRFLWAHAASEPGETAIRPVVSEYALKLLESLRQDFAMAALPMIRKEFWPHGRPMAASLTHDVDVVRRGKLPRGIAVRDVTAALRSLSRGRFGQTSRQLAGMARVAGAGQDPYWTFDRLLAMEKEHGYRSTYFFMAGRRHREDATYNLAEPRMAKLLVGLAESGCEIGLHGGYGCFRDPAALRLSKTLLETHLGGVVAGHRNHFLRFRAPDSWTAQEAAGFSYDASLGYVDREGYRGGHAFPFRPYDLTAERALDLVEIPLALMEVSLFKYRRLRGDQAEEAMRTVLEQTRAVHGLAVLLWHNDTLYDPDCPGSGRLYQRAMAWLAEHNAHVAPCGEIDRWWRAREAVRLSPLPQGRTGWRLEAPQRIEGLVLRVSPPDPGASPRPVGRPQVSIRRDGPDYLVEIAHLPAGSGLSIEF